MAVTYPYVTYGFSYCYRTAEKKNPRLSA